MKQNGYHSEDHEAIILRLDSYFIVQQSLILGTSAHDASEKSTSALCYMPTSSSILHVVMTTTHSINHLEHSNPSSAITPSSFSMKSVAKSDKKALAMLVTSSNSNKYTLFSDEATGVRSVYIQCSIPSTLDAFRQFETSSRNTYVGRGMVEYGTDVYFVFSQQYTASGECLVV